MDAMEGTLENKVAKATTMLANGTEELRGQVGKARATLARAREAGAPIALIEEQPALAGITP
jgi:hypothetical protein